MAYLRPPWFVRSVFNKVAMKTGMSGILTLTVAGRRSGTPCSVPVVPMEVDGRRYLVSSRGESEWVRNLRAAGVAELAGKGTSERVRATEVPVADRPPLLEEYQRVAGRAVAGLFTQLPDPADHPTFLVEPVAS